MIIDLPKSHYRILNFQPTRAQVLVAVAVIGLVALAWGLGVL